MTHIQNLVTPHHRISAFDFMRIQEDEVSVKVIVSLQVILMSTIISFTISAIAGAIYTVIISIIAIIGIIVWCIRNRPNRQILPIWRFAKIDVFYV